MAYDSPFLYLSDDQIATLVTDETAMYSYITCLSLIQGLLNPFSTNLLLPSVSDIEVGKKWLEEAIEKVPPHTASVIKANRNTALDLVKVGATKKSQDEAAISRVVDDFMAALVRQYQLIRSGSSHLLHATAAG